MHDEVAALPREYLELLCEMSKDPGARRVLPDGVVDTVARLLAMTDDTPQNALDAMYHRCCVDKLARLDEIDRRVKCAVDEWYSDSSNSTGRLAGMPQHVLAGIHSSERQSFTSELNAWRRRHPLTYFDVRRSHGSRWKSR